MKVSHFIAFFLYTVFLFGQTTLTYMDAVPDAQNIDHYKLNAAILNALNTYRLQQQLDILITRQELASTAYDATRFLYKNDMATFKKKVNHKRFSDMAKKYFASNKFQYFIIDTRLNFGDYQYTYKEIGQNIVEEIISKSRNLETINDTELKYVGLSFLKLKYKQKLKGIIIVGSYQAINAGIRARYDYKYPSYSYLFANINHSAYHLKPYDSRECSRCKRFDFYQELRDNITIKNHKAILEFNDKRSFYRLFRNRHDGLAVDLVFKEQFPCDTNNIINYNLINTGMMLKPAYKRRLYRKNEFKNRRDPNIKIPLARELYIQDIMGNRHIHSVYEINLYVIQNKHICKIITPENNYLGHKEIIRLLPDTAISRSYAQQHKVPLPDQYEFMIPFEKGKYSYRNYDIKPFVKTLNKYHHRIQSISLFAYSSIEGNDEFNKNLQQKRAESILEILQDYEDSPATTKIETKDNWYAFYRDIKGTSYAFLENLPTDSVILFVNQYQHQNELEAILQNHRYAKVMMHVDFTFKNEKQEVDFYRDRLKSHIQKKEPASAKYYQSVCITKILNQELPGNCLTGIIIPREKTYSSLLLNQLWLDKYILSGEETSLSLEEINPLFMLDSGNCFIRYNYALSYIHTIQDIREYNEARIEQHISELYKSAMPEEHVKKLSLEASIKKIDLLMQEIPVYKKDQIAEITDSISLTSDNSLAYAKVFLKRGQFELAQKILESYATPENTDHDFWKTYLSVFSPNHNNICNHTFLSALKNYQKLFPQHFCNLIWNEFYSIQIFENPQVKKLFCDYCRTSIKKKK